MNSPSQPLSESTADDRAIYQRLNLTLESVSKFCKRWQIVELAVFGSILREDFRPEGADPSDVDFLYVSAPEARYGFQFFDMRSELAQLIGRNVDLISKRGIENSRNPLRRKTILESAQIIYAERPTVSS